MLKAKFRVRKILRGLEGDYVWEESYLFPTNLGNKDWATDSPVGALQIRITNPKAFGQLKSGALYYLTLEEIE
mgnify:CR=1 FL=1